MPTSPQKDSLEVPLEMDYLMLGAEEILSESLDDVYKRFHIALLATKAGKDTGGTMKTLEHRNPN